MASSRSAAPERHSRALGAAAAAEVLAAGRADVLPDVLPGLLEAVAEPCPALPEPPAVVVHAGPAGLPVPGCTPAEGLLDPRTFLAWAASDATATVVVELLADEPTLVWVNRACATLLACAEQDLVGRPLSRLRRSPLVPRSAQLSDAGQPLLDEVRVAETDTQVQRADGRVVPVHVTSTPAGTGGPARWVLRLADRSGESQVQQHLKASQERFRVLSDQTPVGIFSSERGLRLGYVNDRFCAIMGERPERLLGTDWLARLLPDDVETALSGLRSVLQGTPVELALRVPLPGGDARSLRVRVVPVPDGRDTGFVGTVEDVTAQLAWEEVLEHQARHDPLTGLPNRRALLERTAAALAEGRPLALMLLDLDDFKLVNDNHGHDAGDALLTAVGRRLQGAVREHDVVARFGGDEFAVLCLGVVDEQAARAVATRLLDGVSGPTSLGGRDWEVEGSLGVALARPGSTPEDLLREADTAMYQAKAAGKGVWALYDQQARDDALRRQALVEDLQATLTAGRVQVAYQPLMSLEEGREPRLAGVEALARWQHPVRGAVPPQEFVELAEQNGLVGLLGRAVLREACAQMVRWDAELGIAAPASVAVNVSVLQLRAGGFVEEVAQALVDSGLPGERLCLELTESAVLQDSAAAVRTLASLRELGVRIALDDFGTGYSSLALLRDLPVDQLKIDRSFLADLARSGSDVVVSAVVGLAAALGLEAVAEGVETQQQLDELRRLRCPLAQGYLFSRPLPPHELAVWLGGES